MFVQQPSVQEYLDAKNQVEARTLHKVVRLVPYGFDGDYLFTEHSLRMLSADSPGWERQDREIIKAWHRAQGMDRAEAIGAKETLLARIETHSKQQSIQRG